MALWSPIECICPGCGQVHVRNGGSSPNPPGYKPIIDCPECVQRKLEEEIEIIKTSAFGAAIVKARYGETAREVMLEAELEVIREKLVGKTRLPEYWRAVRRKIEDR